MKGKERFIGVQSPRVVTIVKKVIAPYRADQLTGIWERLIESPYFEEKFAGIVIYQVKFLPLSAATWRTDLQTIASLVNRNRVVWWASCDGISGRILGRLIAKHGQKVARQIAGWRRAKNPWLKRMSIVSFVGHARKGDQSFEGAQRLILSTASEVIKSDHRFHQTGVGWVLREIYKGSPRIAERFIDTHLPLFSREGLRYAIEKMPDTKRKRYLIRGRSLMNDKSE